MIFNISIIVFLLISASEQSYDYLEEIPAHFVELNKAFPNFCILSGDQAKKQIALTFDDGPSPVSGSVVKLLEEHGAKGNFFWLGENLHESVDFVEETSRNHYVANHSWDHSNGWETSVEVLWQGQVNRTNNEFKRLGLKKPKYYRPPFGSITKEQVGFLRDQGIKTVLWSLSTLDWDTSRNSAHEIFTRFKLGIHPGAIVLLHDRGFNDEGQNMLAALSQILQFGKEQGYQFVTIDEMIKNDE